MRHARDGCHGSGFWNEHIIIKMMLPFCSALTARVRYDRPSRSRSTKYTIGVAADALERK